ncbi:hypothetical protein OHC33_009206 [Knufia fluminis]|uniref:Fungal N-terminal domain-containing protein n=1 Tax=Knufia fluminis TaxID=191047 RepID=A0AAN8I1T0_9EURO|nr:hypothetical protein OHC33_009206 [Knufia fluminis]
MAEPFSIVTGAVGLIALAAHVSTKLRTVFKSAAANNWVQKAQDHITIVIHHVEHLRNNVTRHHCAKQGSYYQAAVDNVGERCRKLLRKMEATLDGVLRTAKLSSKTWAKMLRAGKMILADPRLQKYEQELCSEGLYLEKASNDLVKHFFSPMGSQFIEAQQNNSLIEDAMANHISSMRRGSRTPCLKRFLGAITGIARFSTSALRRTTFFDLARATMKMMKADVLRGATQNERLMRINPASWYISDGRLVMPRSRRQPKPPRLTRLFTQDRVEQLLPAHTPHYTYYKILLDARSELDPFGRLLDALILLVIEPVHRFLVSSTAVHTRSPDNDNRAKGAGHHTLAISAQYTL